MDKEFEALRIRLSHFFTRQMSSLKKCGLTYSKNAHKLIWLFSLIKHWTVSALPYVVPIGRPVSVYLLLILLGFV